MKFGVIGAMTEEIELLLDHMHDVSKLTIARMSFYDGKLDNTPITLVACYMGKVNASVATQILIERFAATKIIFTGVAGSLSASIDIGDIVVSSACVNHDMDAGGLGYAPGQNPDIDMIEFPADPLLKASALKAGQALCNDVALFEGCIATGDQFVNDRAVKKRIVELFGALCCDMEGAAVAQTAWLFDVPYVVIRAISDKADEDSTLDFRTFLTESSRRCASLVEYMVKHVNE